MPVSGWGDTYSPKRKGGRKRGRGQRLSGGRAVGLPGAKKPVPVRPAKPITFKPVGTTAAAPAAPPVQPLDPELENQKIIGQRDVALSDLYGTWQQANLDQRFGFGAGGAANPYSDAAKLQENFKRSVLGTSSSYASAGQYNTGAYGSAQNENARNYSMGYDALRRAYDEASGNIAFGRAQTYAQAGTAVDAEKFNALIRALGGL